MKTEKESSHKDTKALRKRNNYFKTSCLRDLVAKKGFTPLEKAVNLHWRVSRSLNSMSLQTLRRRNSLTGFTLPELLTVIAIIAILIGVLMPALSQVKRIARETKQKAQIGSIEMGINMYKNDFGAYPPSNGNNWDGVTFSYCGAQTLAEAMFGQDLLGFRTDSDYRNDGKDNSSVDNTTRRYIYYTMNTAEKNSKLVNRKDPYLDRTNIDIFTPRQIFDEDTYSIPPIAKVVSDRYVICDVFTAVTRPIDLDGDGIADMKAKIGTPVLYFRANPSAINTELIPSLSGNAAQLAMNIYNWRDNYYFINLKKVTDGKTPHPICEQTGAKFYGFIADPMIPKIDSTTCGRPVRPDSFLLISAGNDGLYGTKDDICNFDPNLP